MAKAKQPKLRVVPEPAASPNVAVSLPESADPDDFFAVQLRTSDLTNAGILRNDLAIVYQTDDLQSGDLVEYERAGLLYVRRYYPAPGGRVRLETIEDDYKSDVFKPHEVKFLCKSRLK